MPCCPDDDRIVATAARPALPTPANGSKLPVQDHPSALVKNPCPRIWPLYHVPLYLPRAPVASVSYAAARTSYVSRDHRAPQAPVSVGIDHLALTVLQPVDKPTVVRVAIRVPVRVLATARGGALGLVTVGPGDGAVPLLIVTGRHRRGHGCRQLGPSCVATTVFPAERRRQLFAFPGGLLVTRILQVQPEVTRISQEWQWRELYIDDIIVCCNRRRDTFLLCHAYGNERGCAAYAEGGALWRGGGVFSPYPCRCLLGSACWLEDRRAAARRRLGSMLM